MLSGRIFVLVPLRYVPIVVKISHRSIKLSVPTSSVLFVCTAFFSVCINRKHDPILPIKGFPFFPIRNCNWKRSYKFMSCHVMQESLKKTAKMKLVFHLQTLNAIYHPFINFQNLFFIKLSKS